MSSPIAPHLADGAPAPSETTDKSIPTPRPARRPRRRRRWRHLLIVTHRWGSIIGGLFLVVIATTGSILVYEPEIMRALNSHAYTVADPNAPEQVTPGQAVAAVRRIHPGHPVSGVTKEAGVYRVDGDQTAYTVDPADGRIIGMVEERPGWLGLTRNIHHCFLTCKGLPGHLPVMSTKIPGTEMLSARGTPVTVAGFILGANAVLLIFLSLTGLWLWFPRSRRWRSAVTVRLHRGRFARDTDLHKVIGVIAILPLLVWGISGTRFEFGAVSKIWYAATLSEERTPPKVRPGPAGDPDMSIDDVAAIAERTVPGATVTRISMPRGKDPKASYMVVMRHGYDAMEHSRNPGDIRVTVARKGGDAVQSRGRADQDLSQRIWEQWTYPAHAGTLVGPWGRAAWFFAGLTPLALMITGLSTWLYRRRTARKRSAARAARTTARTA